MGMSASQARLLSITARLTNNEFKSQLITNSKLRLATETDKVTQKYMDALDSQMLMFCNYDDNGASSKVQLTPAILHEYAPMKNQYALINNAGKMLVTSKDAENYETTGNLNDFLAKYGLVEKSNAQLVFESEYANYVAQMNDYNTALTKYDTVIYPQYESDKAAYDALIDKYNQDKSTYDNYFNGSADDPNTLPWYNKQYQNYLVKYQEYLNLVQQGNLYDDFSSIVGTYDTATSTGASFCYYYALNGSSGCYKHLLGFLIDYDGSNSKPCEGQTYKNSLGTEFKLSGSTGGGMDSSVYNDSTNSEKFKKISDAINEKNSDGTYKRYCDGNDSYKYTLNGTTYNEVGNSLEIAKKNGQTITDTMRLMSDYKESPDGTYTVKSLREKVIDMFYILQNNLVTDTNVMRTMLISLTDGDMQNLGKEPEPPTMPEQPSEPVYPGDPPKAPAKPEKPAEPMPPVMSIKVNDSEKAQWYINLWYGMNGSDTANVVEMKENDDGTYEYTVTSIGVKGTKINGSDDKPVYSFTTNSNSKNGANYEVLDDRLYNSAEWLEFALKEGIITMKQAQFTSPAENSQKALTMSGSGITWNSIVYTNGPDMVYVDDEKAIAKAEVEYTKAVKEIEAKDKKYDTDLQKLDTEHNALQTEYESIKVVIGKNVDRSFKAFS